MVLMIRVNPPTQAACLAISEGVRGVNLRTLDAPRVVPAEREREREIRQALLAVFGDLKSRTDFVAQTQKCGLKSYESWIVICGL